MQKGGSEIESGVEKEGGGGSEIGLTVTSFRIMLS